MIKVEYERPIDTEQDLIESGKDLYLPQGMSVTLNYQLSATLTKKTLFRRSLTRGTIFAYNRGIMDPKAEQRMVTFGEGERVSEFCLDPQCLYVCLRWSQAICQRSNLVWNDGHGEKIWFPTIPARQGIDCPRVWSLSHPQIQAVDRRRWTCSLEDGRGRTISTLDKVLIVLTRFPRQDCIFHFSVYTHPSTSIRLTWKRRTMIWSPSKWNTLLELWLCWHLDIFCQALLSSGSRFGKESVTPLEFKDEMISITLSRF